MKIACPISKLTEIEPLAEAGADEFYCGILYGKERINCRPATSKFNFKNLEELKRAIEISHSFNKDIWLVINYRMPFSFPFSQKGKSMVKNGLELFKEAAKLGVDGVIVADLPLLLEILSFSPRPENIKLACSTMLPVLNSQSINFFKKLGYQRMILDRQMTVKEIQSIDKKVEDIELEIFTNCECLYLDGFCKLEAIGLEHFSSGQDRVPCRFPFNFTIPHSNLNKKSGKEIISSLRRNTTWMPLTRWYLSSLFHFIKLRNVLILKVTARGIPLMYLVPVVKAFKLASNFLVNSRPSHKDYLNFCKKELGLFFKYDFKDGYMNPF